MTTFNLTEPARLNFAMLSLEGLCVGDCFGQRFFIPGSDRLLPRRQSPPGPWSYTDDTAMAVSVVRVLREHGEIEQDRLAGLFADEYGRHPHRGYGAGAHGLLQAVHHGARWQDAAPAMFSGTGSMGNGGAMRVAPVGAYFSDDLDRVAEQAALSAEVTHAHPEGQAGAVAVAVAAALAMRVNRGNVPNDTALLFDCVLEHTPDGPMRTRLKQATVLPASMQLDRVAGTLGNGSGIIAMDTVPFTLWCAFHYLDNYREALWTCVRAGGDVDTTCAIVGGIVALATGRGGIPQVWRDASEPLPIGNGEDEEQ
ncbi:ADP-ribosylglycohydrolase family protein [Phycisphaeraceae bacterium D3-23]